MVQYTSWLDNQRYQAIDDRLAAFVYPWSNVGSGSYDSSHSQPGVVITPSGGGLKVSQRGAGANMSVDVAAGHCLIGVNGDTRGTYMGFNDTTKNIAVNASHATLGRIDAIYARITDANHGDVTSAFETVYVAGTPAGSPVEPAAPSSYVLKLATISVAAAATQVVTANITDTRVFTSPVNTAGRFTATPAQVTEGSHWHNPSTNTLDWTFASSLSRYAKADGLNWTTYTPTLTASTTPPTLGTGNVVFGEYKRSSLNADWIHCRGFIKFGNSGGSAGSGNYRITLPFTAGVCAANTTQHGIGQFYIANNTQPNAILPYIPNGGGVNYMQMINTRTGASAGDIITNSSPVTWNSANSTDAFMWWITYTDVDTI